MPLILWLTCRRGSWKCCRWTVLESGADLSRARPVVRTHPIVRTHPAAPGSVKHLSSATVTGRKNGFELN